MTDKSPNDLVRSAETRLKSLKKRFNESLTQLNDPSSERVQEMLRDARLKRAQAYEKKRGEYIDELPEAARQILKLSSPEFLEPLSESRIKAIAEGNMRKEVEPEVAPAPAEGARRGRAAE